MMLVDMGSPVCTGCHFEYPIKDASLISLWEVWSGENAPLKEENAKSFRSWASLVDHGARIAAVAATGMPPRQMDRWPSPISASTVKSPY